jgi:hypothetical protein
LPYSSFSPLGAGPANFSNVGAIVLEFNGVGHIGSDITIDSIGTVPEPSTLALAAIGVSILGLGWRWRENQRLRMVKNRCQVSTCFATGI